MYIKIRVIFRLSNLHEKNIKTTMNPPTFMSYFSIATWMNQNDTVNAEEYCDFGTYSRFRVHQSEADCVFPIFLGQLIENCPCWLLRYIVQQICEVRLLWIRCLSMPRKGKVGYHLKHKCCCFVYVGSEADRQQVINRINGRILFQYSGILWASTFEQIRYLNFLVAYPENRLRGIRVGKIVAEIASSKNAYEVVR